ncbi:MAG TPA: ABC transporter permease [Terriglobia bacterium]|nr:ABC transporter permease [Terriglobia bacterium]
MSTIRRLSFRVLSVFRSGRADADLAGGTDPHLQLLRDKVPSAPDRAKESQHDARSFWVFDSWWLDVKLGVRMLVKYPGLALAGGVGIAVAVAIAAGGFSLIYDNFLTSSVPLEEGDRLVSIELWDSAASNPEPRILRDYHVWREELKSVQEISAFRILAPNLIASGAQPESVRVAAMSASGFRVARVRPLMGRYIEEEHEREGAPSVVVIGENVWRNRFAGDPAILGRIIQLGATPHTIVGVMPKGFAFPVNDHFWVPLRAGFATPEPLTGPALRVFGRLAPGATLAGAQAELAAIGQRTALAFPKIYAPLRPQVMPYARPFAGIHGTMDVTGLLAMQGIFVALLVLVCLNVTILVYTRTATRQAEIGVRTALGASRGRIVAQLFIEAFVLSAVAALAGVAIAALALRWIATATLPLASVLPFWVSFRLSPQAVLYAVVLSVFAAAIVGIVPALQATRRRLQTGLRVTGAGGMRLGKTWTILIIAQVSFAVALLPPALSSAWKDIQDGFAGLGFAAEEFLSVQLGMDSVPGAAAGTREFTRRFASRQTELMRRLEAESRVSSVTFAMFYPGDEGNARIEAEGVAPFPSQSGVAASGSAIRSETEVHEVRFNRVDVNFFRTFEVPILAGRGFEPADIASAGAGPSLQNGELPEGGAVVVNLSFAQRIFGRNALGRRIRYVDRNRGAAAQDAESRRWYEIVGIVTDFPTGASPGMRDTEIKVYHVVAAGQVQPAAIAIRMRDGAPSTFTQRLREIAAAVDPDLHLRDIRGLDEALRSEQWISRMTAAAFVAITVSVLMLSSAGIYALMSFTVSQRRKEIGIRIALGADWKRIVTSIFSRALLQLASGAALGAALGITLQKASGDVLMRGNAAVVVPVVSLVILVVGFLAALGPTRRSLRIDPTEALREE